MTKDKLIEFLRSAVHIQDPDIGSDSKYLAMSDEDIALYIQVAVSRDFPNITSIEVIPQSCVYPVLLLAKKELYYALAVIEAPLYDMGADNNNYLKRDQRFQHYMKLVTATDEEFDKYNEDNATGTHGTVVTYDVLLNNRYFTPDYMNKGVAPIVALHEDQVFSDSVELSWERVVINFAKYELYVSKSLLYDPYAKVQPLDSLEPTLIGMRDTRSKVRIEQLEPKTQYFICIVYTDKCGLKGYSQITVTTPKEQG